MRLAGLPLPQVLPCHPLHRLKAWHSAAGSRPLLASEPLIAPVLLVFASALRRWIRWLVGARIRLLFRGVPVQDLKVILAFRLGVPCPLNSERTSRFFHEDIHGVIVVYYSSSDTQSCNQALEASSLLCWWSCADVPSGGRK
jgi:hypothetical protein